MSGERVDEQPIEERAIRAVLGNQIAIMLALAMLLEKGDPLSKWREERAAQDLRDRAQRCEEWKNASLRN